MDIEEIAELIGTGTAKLRGKGKPVLDFVRLVAHSEPMETDPNWWAIRIDLARN
jgi:hypothetical protein